MRAVVVENEMNIKLLALLLQSNRGTYGTPANNAGDEADR
jgi:hypothetical protein